MRQISVLGAAESACSVFGRAQSGAIARRLATSLDSWWGVNYAGLPMRLKIASLHSQNGNFG